MRDSLGGAAQTMTKLSLGGLALIAVLGCPSQRPQAATRHISLLQQDSSFSTGRSHRIQGPAWCLSYEPDTVRIAGTLRQITYPGRPNYESIANGDEPETGYYLVLAKEVCTKGDSSSSDAYPVSHVDTVQLVLDSAGYVRLRPSLGTTTTLSGTLFAAQTGHHHAPILLQVSRDN